MNRSFKPGDEVRIVESLVLFKGKRGTVVRILSDRDRENYGFDYDVKLTKSPSTVWDVYSFKEGELQPLRGPW